MDNLVDGVENGKSPLLSDKPDFSNEFLFEKACTVSVKNPRVLLSKRIAPCRAVCRTIPNRNLFQEYVKLLLRVGQKYGTIIEGVSPILKYKRG